MLLDTSRPVLTRQGARTSVSQSSCQYQSNEVSPLALRWGKWTQGELGERLWWRAEPTSSWVRRDQCYLYFFSRDMNRTGFCALSLFPYLSLYLLLLPPHIRTYMHLASLVLRESIYIYIYLPLCLSVSLSVCLFISLKLYFFRDTASSNNPLRAPTYAAVLTLCTIGTAEALSSIERRSIYQFYLRAKDPCGGFRIHKWVNISSISLSFILSFSFFLCLSLCLFLFSLSDPLLVSLSLSLSLSLCLSLCESLSLSLCLSLSLFFCLSLSLSLPLSLSDSLVVSLSLYPCLSLWFSLCLCLSLSIFASLSISLSLSLSLCLSLFFFPSFFPFYFSFLSSFPSFLPSSTSFLDSLLAILTSFPSFFPSLTSFSNFLLWLPSFILYPLSLV